MRPALEAEVKRLDWEKNYRLMGFVQDVIPWFGVFDLFAMSSREEGLGSSVLDAFLYGVPVASTDAGGLRECVEGHGLVSPAGSPAGWPKTSIACWKSRTWARVGRKSRELCPETPLRGRHGQDLPGIMQESCRLAAGHAGNCKSPCFPDEGIRGPVPTESDSSAKNIFQTVGEIISPGRRRRFRWPSSRVGRGQAPGRRRQPRPS